MYGSYLYSNARVNGAIKKTRASSETVSFAVNKFITLSLIDLFLQMETAADDNAV